MAANVRRVEISVDRGFFGAQQLTYRWRIRRGHNILGHGAQAYSRRIDAIRTAATVCGGTWDPKTQSIVTHDDVIEVVFK